jgi:hypothetical protein
MGRTDQFAGRAGCWSPDLMTAILYHNPLIYSHLRSKIRNHQRNRQLLKENPCSSLVYRDLRD